MIYATAGEIELKNLAKLLGLEVMKLSINSI